MHADTVRARWFVVLLSQITFWDATDLSEIRIVAGSEDAELTTLAVAPDDDSFVSAGGDKLVKVPFF